ncbi:uncharacterized protein LOC135118052 [Helicoverpa armigera]|uniref:uncharacterized protein LOC135118052 n=1 Tax=Helicoverpa armigera TaxID=29058 RepID=UPI003083A9A8
MNFFENITFRKARTLSLTEISDEHSSNNLEIDGSASSLPNISNNENNEYVQELQNQIEQLTSQLNSAYEEIKNLNIENTELKKSLKVVTNKNDVLKKATKKLTGEVQTPRKGSQTSTPRNHSQRKPAVIKKPTETLHSNTSGNSNNLGPDVQNTTAQKREGDGNNVTHKSAKHKLCIITELKVYKMTTRRAAIKDLEDKLRATLKDLEASRTLCNQLLQEREDSEVEVKNVVDKNTVLKNDLAELHIQHMDLLDQHNQLQAFVSSFQECSETHELTLRRITELEIELSEAYNKISSYESDLARVQTSDTLNRFTKLVGSTTAVGSSAAIIDLTGDDTITQCPLAGKLVDLVKYSAERYESLTNNLSCTRAHPIPIPEPRPVTTLLDPLHTVPIIHNTKQHKAAFFEEKLRATLKDLETSKDLCKQLLQERDDSEVEVKVIVDKNTELKNQLAELHIEHMDILDQNQHLNRLVSNMQECSDTHELALTRISELEHELCRAHNTITQLESAKSSERSANTCSLYDELVGSASGSCSNQPMITIDLTNDTLAQEKDEKQDFQAAILSTKCLNKGENTLSATVSRILLLLALVLATTDAIFFRMMAWKPSVRFCVNISDALQNRGSPNSILKTLLSRSRAQQHHVVRVADAVNTNPTHPTAGTQAAELDYEVIYIEVKESGRG